VCVWVLRWWHNTVYKDDKSPYLTLFLQSEIIIIIMRLWKLNPCYLSYDTSALELAVFVCFTVHSITLIKTKRMAGEVENQSTGRSRASMLAVLKCLCSKQILELMFDELFLLACLSSMQTLMLYVQSR